MKEREKILRAPGTILIHLYVRERIRRLRPGRFIEIGCGDGTLSHCLLKEGWTGVAYELNEKALKVAESVNREFIERDKFEVRHTDWFKDELEGPVDLVISSLVLEHLTEEQERDYLRRAREATAPDGVAITIVPGSPSHWGIEDEVAGHLRRYDRDMIVGRLRETGWELAHSAGLTYPLSNLLFPLSEYLIGRSEGHLVRETLLNRTVHSGHRTVPMKTRFPSVLKVLLNDITLYPFHWLQKLFRRRDKALILYTEAVHAPE